MLTLFVHFEKILSSLTYWDMFFFLHSNQMEKWRRENNAFHLNTLINLGFFFSLCRRNELLLAHQTMNYQHLIVERLFYVHKLPIQLPSHEWNTFGFTLTLVTMWNIIKCNCFKWISKTMNSTKYLRKKKPNKKKYTHTERSQTLRKCSRKIKNCLSFFHSCC